MLKGKRVVVVSPNQLLCVGLRTILTDCFSPETVDLYPSLASVGLDHSVHYLFLHPEAYILNQELFQGFHGKVVVLSEQDRVDGSLPPAAINVNVSESDIIEQLRQIFAHDSMQRALHEHARLSSREIDVLKLVARGQSNKQIADRLSISMHTVISHRKNITRKLGVKTVSGLTMYAVLNGLIASKDVR